MNKLNQLENDFYDFTHKGKHYYRVFYNIDPIHGKFICGQVDADPGTRFIALNYFYTNGEQTKVIVPDIDQYKAIWKSGKEIKNPMYSLCLIDSEAFFRYFIPSHYIESEPDRTDWIEKGEKIKYILNKLASCKKIVFKNMFDKLYELSKSDKMIDHILSEVDFIDSFDVRINRHNLYFLNDMKDIDHIKDTIDTIYEEVTRNE